MILAVIYSYNLIIIPLCTNQTINLLHKHFYIEDHLKANNNNHHNL